MRHSATISFCIGLGLLSLHVLAESVASKAFTPKLSRCPPGTALVRSTGTTKQTLGPDEERYISTRKRQVLPAAWTSYLHSIESKAKALGVVLPEYVSHVLSSPNLNPTLGLAISGGGYKAATFGAAHLTMLDARNETSVKFGTGGLLQAASYMTGLSGSAWFLTSLAQANFPTFEELIFGPSGRERHSKEPLYSGWLGQFDYFQPGNANQSLEYRNSLLSDVMGKFNAGFPVTLIDIWARALSRHFANGTTPKNILDEDVPHGAGITLSSLSSLPVFQEHAIPFPIVVAASITKKLNASNFFNQSDGPPAPSVVPLSNPLYEFNIFETGSYDPMLTAFTPTKFLGSPNDSICVTGFDQIGYVASCSAGIFSIFNDSAGSLEANPIGGLFLQMNATLSQPGIELDAGALPNPFFGHAKEMFPDSDEKFLRLIDGGEGGEVTPYQPLLVKARGVDTIFAMDSQADNEISFTDGLSVIASQQRASLFSSAYSFPRVPTSVETFKSEGLTKHATFFGCDTTTSDAPVIIYSANGAPPLGQPPVTNLSGIETVFPPDQARAIFDQSFDIATQGIPITNVHGEVEKDPEWPICLACAVTDRMRLKAKAERSGICATCMARYCWS
ncbi:unnamed protein product [Somion occarium]|uniref:Lysophospholipase n=1 Tax=Somion occarium TaxID=3059160 RepID=A0ABP1CS77_9APHY